MFYFSNNHSAYGVFVCLFAGSYKLYFDSLCNFFIKAAFKKLFLFISKVPLSELLYFFLLSLIPSSTQYDFLKFKSSWKVNHISYLLLCNNDLKIRCLKTNICYLTVAKGQELRLAWLGDLPRRTGQNMCETFGPC